MTTRVALIGFGLAGRVFHAPLIAATPGLELAVIGSRQGEAIRGLYPDAVVTPDPHVAATHPGAELVVVATPNDTHASLAAAALRAGKHVVVDKPFTITAAEARALATVADAAHRVLTVFQNRRWDSDFLGVARELAAGRVGDVVEMRSEFSRYRPEVRDRWREKPGPGSGMWYDLGPHLIDQALLLFGVPETVSADLRIQRPGATAIDWFQATLGYGRKRVVLESSMLAADRAPRFLVRGTSGSLLKREGDPQEAQLRAGAIPGGTDWGVDDDPLLFLPDDASAPHELATPRGTWVAFYAAVRDAIASDVTPPVTTAQAASVIAVIEAGLASAAEGRVVGVDCADAERAAWRPVA